MSFDFIYKGHVLESYKKSFLCFNIELVYCIQKRNLNGILYYLIRYIKILIRLKSFLFLNH